MLARTRQNRGRHRRRGVVLVLILAMLGLMAVIGVTFATFSGQTRAGARYYVQAADELNPDRIIDFAIEQLINDTDNPVSALRGHGILRDLYGDDATNAGAFDALPNGLPMLVTNVGGTAPDFTIATNIPTSSYAFPQMAGKSFAGWFLRLELWVYDSSGNVPIQQQVPPVAQSFQIWNDDVSGAFHVFSLTTSDTRTPTLVQPDDMVTGRFPPPSGYTNKLHIKLDNRYRFAMNGSGANFFRGPDGVPLGAYGNYRVNGFLQTEAVNNTLGAGLPATSHLGFPALDLNGDGVPDYHLGDEDYDAADLENWFLALQSADGSVLIPSFHRPSAVRVETDASGNVLIDDWQGIDNVHTTDPLRAIKSAARILRPRAADGHDPVTFPDLKPQPIDTDGDGLDDSWTITYDVDNDGDGVTDSVWLDLGFPVQTDRNGQAYKPLFAIMVQGLNGKLPLNTAGNLAGRAFAADPTNNVNWGDPTNDHISNLGTSPSEINPKFALQAPFDPTNVHFGQRDLSLPTATPPTGIDVATTQLRSILGGTRPQAFSGTGAPLNQDSNFVVNANLTASNNGTPFFLPNNVLDAQDAGPDRSAVAPVAGRWGEAEGVPAFTNIDYITGSLLLDGAGNPIPFVYNNPVGPGRSIYSGGRVDGLDDNFDGMDFFGGEANDFLDPVNALALPSERSRYFVTPRDTIGSGRTIAFNGQRIPGDSMMSIPDTYYTVDIDTDAYRRGYGFDQHGRIGYLHYVRPPGVLPGVTDVLDQTLAPYNLLHGHESYRVPTGVFAALMGAAPYNLSDRGNDAAGNLLPALANAAGTFDNAVLSFGWMSTAGDPRSVLPFYLPDPNAGPPAIPEYPPNGAVYNAWGVAAGVPGSLPLNVGHPLLNNASEMNHYALDPNDEPFTPSDLDWLCNVDASAPSSRLASLAPVSFTNAFNLPRTYLPYAALPIDTSDSLMRRRFFTTDSWDLNYPALGRNQQIGSYLDYTVDTSALRAVAWDATGEVIAAVPIRQVGLSVAHRDRRINLNFPLPASNNPEEPVRQKWIRETYELLKRVVPPSSIDTPEKLAQLSQFVVNIVDFRDPDAASTRFVNTDIVVTPPTGPDQYPTLEFRIDSTTTPPTPIPDILDDAGNPYLPYDTGLKNGRTVDPATGVGTDEKNHSYLEQFGMEYSPIALSEVLAFSFQRNEGGPQDTPRLFVELVNTLTRDGHNAPIDSVTGNAIDGAEASNLNLSDRIVEFRDSGTNDVVARLQPLYYEMVIVEDNAYGRPDRVTGQLLPDDGGTTTERAFWSIKYEDGLAVDKRFSRPMGTNGPGGNEYYYTFANTVEETENTTTGEMKSDYDPTVHESTRREPRVDSPSIPQAIFPNLGTGTAVIPTALTPKYYWLHIRRPANPDQPIDERVLVGGNPNPDYNPGIVVDAIRFPYSNSDSTGTPGTPDTVTAPTQQIYSVQRLQPYRGGQAIPKLPVPAPGTVPELDFAYGYSEQHVPANTGDGSIDVDDHPDNNADVYFGKFGSAAKASTLAIGHTIGRGNDRSDPNKDHFPFFDRDFHSVAELMLVPGCPPGLFTKQFVESVPDNDFDPATAPFIDEDADGQPDSGEYFHTEYDPTKFDQLIQPPTARPSRGRTVAGTPPRVHAEAGQRFDDGNPANPAPKTPFPRVYPYLVDRFFYSYVPDGSNPVYSMAHPNYTGAGPAVAEQDDGWHTILEFFEVPTDLMGATGEVAYGQNHDWVRQDLRPGQINLNLVVDEEVFLGVLDDARVNLASLGPANVTAPVPFVSSGADAAGNPNAWARMADRGAALLDVNGGTGQMKAAFADFLRLQHGGNVLFHYGLGGDPITPIQAYGAGYRPFRSLTFPNIQGTILRPASLLRDPDDTGSLPPISSALRNLDDNMRYGGKVFASGDPQHVGTLMPQLSLRRLFQIPDFLDGSVASEAPLGSPVDHNNANVAPMMGMLPPQVSSGMGLFNEFASLVENGSVPVNPDARLGALVANTADNTLPNYYNDPDDAPADLRQHPWYRTEMLQKISNLTTVRTHQYAVWVTVGYFQVLQDGNPQLAATNPAAAYDRLGPEVVDNNGQTTRHQAFFILDRTKATGFDPTNPGDFRELVVHRRRIK